MKYFRRLNFTDVVYVLNRKFLGTVLPLNSLSILLDKTVKDKAMWSRKKNSFFKFVDNVMLIKEKATIISTYCVQNCSYINHSYYFKPRTRKTRNAWKTIASAVTAYFNADVRAICTEVWWSRKFKVSDTDKKEQHTGRLTAQYLMRARNFGRTIMNLSLNIETWS